MEWIRISQNKLKIMLSAEDARRYELNCESADYSDVVSRTAFREILTDVQRQTGFDATDNKVYIQMYPSKEGGCELFITRIGLLCEEESKKNTPSGQKKVHARVAAREAERRQAICFEELDPLLSLCRRLSNSSCIRESSVFRDEMARWWLMLSGTGTECFCYAREYGREVRVDLARLYLTEHATPICAKDAVKRFSAL